MTAGSIASSARSFDAVLFDWCGTLVRYPTVEERLRTTLAALGRPTQEDEVEHLAGGIAQASRHPDAVALDRRADLSAEDHARAKAVLFEMAGLDLELANALEQTYGDLATYDRHPEASDVIVALSDAGVSIAIVSDFHVDLRPHFSELGLLDRIAGFVISCEVGVMKPDPTVFERAIELVDVAADRCLMVGDNPHPDCGAAALGVSCLILPVPMGPRPRLLDRVTDLVLGDRFG